MNKPARSFWQIWNMSFGFLGIQFGWGLQMANMSAIYEYLGARADQIPILWLAAPLTGLIVQPIIGHASDRTWGRLGRRRPYFLTGAILSSAALILMPRSSALWMAAGLLWILDASINISMEPFRAFVADLLPEQQRTRGFAMQSLLIGLGAVAGSELPWLFRNVFGISAESGAHAIPITVRYAFYAGGVAFIAAVLWTVLTTKEYPPEDLASFNRMKKEKSGIGHAISEILIAIKDMPVTMRQLAPVQFFTWSGLFCMWMFLSVAIARNVFRAPNTQSPLYTQGIEWAGVCNAVMNGVCFAFALLLPVIASKFGRKHTHSLCLTCGALGLISIAFVHHPYWLLLSMTAIGIAWASILAMPYSVLAGSLPPEKTGVYMGIFNFFIVLPEIIVSIGFGRLISKLADVRLFGGMEVRLVVVMVGGLLMIIAAILMQRVLDPGEEKLRHTEEAKLQPVAVK